MLGRKFTDTVKRQLEEVQGYYFIRAVAIIFFSLFYVCCGSTMLLRTASYRSPVFENQKYSDGPLSMGGKVW